MAFDLFSDDSKEGTFTMLMVCTGNICRSPLAETLLRKLLYGLPVSVRSAGIHALVGSPMTEPNQRIAADLGVTDFAQHRARQLTIDDLRAADLVLTLSREHRKEVVELWPRAVRSTFTLREFARLCEAYQIASLARPAAEDTAVRMREVYRSVSQLRGSTPPLTQPLDDDVVDPYRQPEEIYQESASQLIPPVNAIATTLRAAATGNR